MKSGKGVRFQGSAAPRAGLAAGKHGGHGEARRQALYQKCSRKPRLRLSLALLRGPGGEAVDVGARAPPSIDRTSCQHGADRFGSRLASGLRSPPILMIGPRDHSRLQFEGLADMRRGIFSLCGVMRRFPCAVSSAEIGIGPRLTGARRERLRRLCLRIPDSAALVVGVDGCAGTEMSPFAHSGGRHNRRLLPLHKVGDPAPPSRPTSLLNSR